MEQYINKAVIVAKIEDWRDKISKGIFNIPLHGHQKADATFEYEILGLVRDWINTLEVKEFDMPALDNGKMSVERWKEACKAACSDRNYRSHYGFTETRDDYFVDGVQWADEHPEVKEVEEITASDRCIAEEIIINLKRVEQDYRIDLTKEMEWVRNKVKKRG